MKKRIYNGNLNINNIDQHVELNGWIHKRRDLGGMIFIDLRDRSAILQVVFSPENKELFELASSLRNEFCVKIGGIVSARPNGQKNSNLDTGEIEIIADSLHIYNTSPPLPIDFNQNNTEEQRLKFRYLDLRRPIMAERLKTRAKITSFMRNFMNQHDFLDIETPILTKATPEGARDYLVPSRVHKGKFYALPQSPQLFKQLLMMSGFDRYYQIVKCFRDEDLRADRQPEFTQLDIETSFMSAQDLRDLMENMIQQLWLNILAVDLGSFPILTYDEAIRRFGSDKPDLRNPLEFIDLADIVKDLDFQVLSKAANDENGRVVALKIPQGASLTRKQIDEYTTFVGIYGAKGLLWLKVNDLNAGIAGIQGPTTKFFTEDTIQQVITRTGAVDGDLIFCIADQYNTASEAMGALRLKLGLDLALTDLTAWKALWVIDFPMFEFDGERWVAMHHPFTSPKDISIEELKQTPDKAKANAYDMVINGYEVGGGSVRINNNELQRTVFDLLNISTEEQQEKFGFLLDALQYGAPPHAGIAFGLDRVTMLLTKTDNIRDVIAFPKTTAATCLMTDAPSSVAKDTLDELYIEVQKKSK